MLCIISKKCSSIVSHPRWMALFTLATLHYKIFTPLLFRSMAQILPFGKFKKAFCGNLSPYEEMKTITSRDQPNQLQTKPLAPLAHVSEPCRVAGKLVVRVRQVSQVSFSTRDVCQRNLLSHEAASAKCRLLLAHSMQGQRDQRPICAQEFLRPPSIVEPSEKVLDGIGGGGKEKWW